IIYGGEGNDTIRGNTGTDHLRGQEGEDTFEFSLGDGIDVIYDSDGTDIVRFNGISKANISSYLISNTDGTPYLQIQYNNTDDVVFIKDGLTGGIKSYEFSDGSMWTSAEMVANTLAESIDYRMDKTGSLFGGSFNDVLVGSTGNDEIYGQDGNDIIAGNTGDDLLIGGLGQDTYRIGTGTGRDTIVESDDESDTIQIQLGANIADLTYEQQGNNLYIHFKNSRDGVIILDFYLGNHTWQIEDESGGSLFIQKDNVPGGATPILPATIEDAWTDFEKQIQSYYEGLMRVSSYQKQSDGTYTKTTNNGYVHTNYTMDILTTNITTNDPSYMRELPQTDQQQTGYRSEIVVTNISTRPGGIRLSIGAGSSNSNFVNINDLATSGYGGIQLQNNTIPIVSENSLMDPFSGYSQNSLTGYWYYT
ncbi:MAG: hypothetical protein K8F30_04020, partial [Taibaiella sp.]|nr:hypothetical protein [Taibaiella sp.]